MSLAPHAKPAPPRRKTRSTTLFAIAYISRKSLMATASTNTRRGVSGDAATRCAAFPLRIVCLVHLKIARDVPRLLEFAILVWTIPAPVVQIHIAIPATDASGRVERLHHSANSLKRGRRLSF